jgi:hypothetical protein
MSELYRAIHFYGPQLRVPLADAARYLHDEAERAGEPPRVLCLRDEHSWEDEGSDLAWQVTLILGERPGQ